MEDDNVMRFLNVVRVGRYIIIADTENEDDVEDVAESVAQLLDDSFSEAKSFSKP